MKLIDLTGKRFARLLVKERSKTRKRDRIFWDCICDCGNEVAIAGDHLSRGESTSCGCAAAENAKALFTKHGLSKTRTYRIWMAMNKRCHWGNYPEWHLYGGRGIAVCRKWQQDFAAFLDDMGECPPGLSIDRIDNDGNYEPGNCRWATAKQQAANRRPARSRKTTVCGLSRATFRRAEKSGEESS